MSVETTLADNTPLGPNDYSVAAVYIPETGMIYVSEDNERTISAESALFVKQAFKDAGQPPRRFDDLKYVATVAEEFTHFVQHTHGVIPGSEHPVQTSADRQLDIETYGVKLSRERRRFIVGAMRRTFEIMNYQGSPPRGLVLIDGHIYFRNVTNPEQARYLQHLDSEYHYHHYDYEAEARKVQNEVLNWWFRDRLKLGFSVSLS